MSDHAICRMTHRQGHGLLVAPQDTMPIPASLASLLAGMTPEELEEVADLVRDSRPGRAKVQRRPMDDAGLDDAGNVLVHTHSMFERARGYCAACHLR